MGGLLECHSDAGKMRLSCTARTSSFETLEALGAVPDKFDLVITDTTMRDVTGVLLAKIFIDIRSDISIIICTGFSEKISEDKAKAMGVRGNVMKRWLKVNLINNGAMVTTYCLVLVHP